MITIISNSLKNTTMNIKEGIDLVFDEAGVCEDVPFDLAKLIAPMHGFKLVGLSDEEKVVVEEYVDLINSQRAAEAAAGLVPMRGLGSSPKDIKQTIVHRTVAGRLPRSMQEQQSSPQVSEEDSQAQLGSTPAKPKVKIGGKKKVSGVRTA